MSAGKGDKWRKTDFKKYYRNFDRIFKKKEDCCLNLEKDRKTNKSISNDASHK